MYKMKRPVTYSEVGVDFKADMAQIINYFQDCSCFQSDSLGAGPELLERSGTVWILNSWQIAVDRYPVYGEEITVGTWAYDFKGLLGMRNFIIDDDTGGRIVRANSVWAMLDLETGKPVRLNENHTKMYPLEAREPMDYAGRKIRVSGVFECLDRVRVSRACLDTNQHMNNGRYVAIAMEYLPEDFSLHQVRVEYKHPAFYGQELVIKRQMEAGKASVIFENEQGQVCVIIEFTE